MDIQATALVTGAAGDIGSATAKLLATKGYRLALNDHPSAATKLANIALELSELTEVCCIEFDVAVRSEVDAGFSNLVGKNMAPTRIFNNAGVQGQFGRIDQLDPDDVNTVMRINVGGALNVIAAATPILSQHPKESGLAIVNTASMAGVSGAPNMAAYSASKAAIIGLTKSAAKDLAPLGIRVNAISPAFVGPGAMWDRQVALQASADSQYYSSDPDEVAKQMILMIPLRRYGSTAEVASVVEFLLSNAASYLTGVNIEIAGGST